MSIEADPGCQNADLSDYAHGGIIYILVNELMPDLIKIGKTERLRDRVMDLNRQTGVPGPFDVHFAARVKDMKEVEQLMHQAFADRRIGKKEFFRLDPDQAKAVLRLATISDVTHEAQEYAMQSLDTAAERQELLENRSRRQRATFDRLAIPIGSTLIYLRNQEIRCLVSSGTKVSYEDEEFALSALTKKLRWELEGIEHAAERGWDKWQYGGERLSDIADRILQVKPS